ncbi:MAG: RteC domain-containing protein [Bacteroidia bacterium]
MQKYSDTLYYELEEQLKFISLETDSILKVSELCIDVIQASLAKLKSFIIKYKFRSQGEEIKFFKDIKPLFCSKLFYHISVYNIETHKPNGGHKVTKKYLQNELDKLKRYFDTNLEFYKYYRTGSNYLDHKYFVRGKHDIRLSVEPFYFETDPKFSTSNDFKISMILAYDLLQVYLEDELVELDKKEPRKKSQDIHKSNLSWTDSKVALIELLYALHSQGVFNNGKAELKDIAGFIENSFNIELGQYHRTFLEIRMRKSVRTKFMDSLRENLIKRMDDADEPLQ